MNLGRTLNPWAEVSLQRLCHKDFSKVLRPTAMLPRSEGTIPTCAISS